MSKFIGVLLLVLQSFSLGAASLCENQIQLKTDASILVPGALAAPATSDIFHDPADTATFVHAVDDLISADSRIFNLGTGSGSDTASIAQRAQSVFGVDISTASVAYAREHFSRTNVRFARYDYFNAGPTELAAQWPFPQPFNFLVSNPPYVPCVSKGLCPIQSMYGGPDGARFIREIISYAEALRIPKLAFSIGSYSSPKSVFNFLNEKGYRVVALTLSPVSFGSFSMANLAHIKELEAAGSAYLWKSANGHDQGYMILGLSCLRTEEATSRTSLTLDEFEKILQGVSRLSPQNFKDAETLRPKNFPLRILNLNSEQLTNAQRYAAEVLPQMREGPNTYRMLPAGISPPLQKAFQALFDLTRDPWKTFLLLQEFEREVIDLAQLSSISLDEAFEKVLSTGEKKYGFADPVRITDYLSQDDFLKLLSEGKPIADDYWIGKPHSRDGHRVQSLLEARYIERLFDSRDLYIQLYKEMGDPEGAVTGLNWEGTGINTSLIVPGNSMTFPNLWGFLHDTPFFNFEGHRRSPNDFTNPEFFSGLRKYLPGLVGWK